MLGKEKVVLCNMAIKYMLRGYIEEMKQNVEYVFSSRAKFPELRIDGYCREGQTICPSVADLLGGAHAQSIARNLYPARHKFVLTRTLFG